MNFKTLVFVAVCLLLALPALPQEASAGLTGRVTDPSGAAIVGAAVVARDQDRGTEYPTKTNEDGVYAIPRVPVGTYELRVETSGFKTYIQPNIVLELNQRGRVDVQMTVGQISERVEVSAEAPLLQTERTEVGSVITNQTIVNTPLVSRNPIALTLLAPGVTTPNPSGFNNGQRTVGGGRPYVNGNREEANNFLLDGADNNQVSENQTAYQPNLDAIQEFKMITNNAPAEFGNFQGGIINMIIKSGTNDFHGSVFEHFRNDVLNANAWARNWQAGVNNNPVLNKPAALRWNQFGGTAGGRIYRDKLFFFADYQGLRRADPGVPNSISVMPVEFRQGNFSKLLDTSYTGATAPIVIYNPYETDASGNRVPFNNNIIPQNLLSPAAVKLFNDPKYYPAPLNGNLRFNQINAASNYTKSDQGDIKLDWKPSASDDLSVRYSNGRQDRPGTNSFPLTYNTFAIAPFQNGVVNWTRTFSPTLVNEARIGVNHIFQQNGGEDKGLGDIAQSVGIAGAGAGLLSLTGFTYATGAGVGNANVGTQQLFANTTYHYADNVTIVHGRHMVRTGGQLLRQHINTFYAGNNGRTGLIEFNGRFSQGPSPTSPTSRAVSEVDIMLGLPSRIGRGVSTGTWGHRKTIYGLYVQDDWRATDTLTLNLGLRWEYHTPLVEVADRQSNFEPFTGKLLLAGKDGNSRALYNPFKKDFQPRIGFAWTPGMLSKKVVVRGAYTISSFMEGTGTNLRLPLNPPFNFEFDTRYDTPQFVLPGSTLDQGLSVLNPNDPYRGATIRLWDPNVRPANTQQWNLTLEFQLPANNVLTTGYVGQHGTHLIVPMPYFQRQLMPDGTTRPSPYLSGNPALTSVIGQISGTEANGNQRYDAWQSTLRKRFGAGVEYQLSYTWSKAMADAIGYYGEGGQAGGQSAYMQNLYDRSADWGPAYFDTTHNFSGSVVYEMPWGRKKMWGSSWNPVVDAVLGGWQLGGIFTAHTGFPLTMKSSTDTSGTLSRGARADVVKAPSDPHNVGPGTKWLDITAFAPPRAGTFGNVGVGTVRGPGMKRFDLSLGKKFPVKESKWFELRGEAFNLTNTPIFNSPASQNVQNSLFGEINSAQGERSVQIVGRFVF